MSINSVEELYAGLGYGNVTLPQIMTKLREVYKEYNKNKEDAKDLKQEQAKHNFNTPEKQKKN